MLAAIGYMLYVIFSVLITAAALVFMFLGICVVLGW